MRAEQWTNLVIEVEGVPNPPKYAISNFGRIKSFQGTDTGKIIKGSIIQGYRSLNIRLPQGKSFNRYIHKIIAEAFLEKPSDKHIFVVHLDYDKQNNHFENLKYVTRIEMTEHHRSNPNVLNKKIPTTSKQYKLTETKVRLIKKMVKEDKTRLKMIAKQFGITHTQLNRIRSGENWKHVTIDD
jgi:hypothetical protein